MGGIIFAFRWVWSYMWLSVCVCMMIHAPHGRFEVVERSPQTFSKPMYGTRPCCLVQAITRHTCPDPHLGSWNCLPHQAHIAPSETMSSIDQQGSSLGSFPTFPSPLSQLYAAFGLLTMSQVMSGGRQRQINRFEVVHEYIYIYVAMCSKRWRK